MIGLPVAAATIVLLAPAIAAGPNLDLPTFVDDVAPILHANCVSCDQPGEIGPMSLRTYLEVRPWARSIARGREPGHAAVGRRPGLRTVVERHQPKLRRFQRKPL